MKNLDDEMNELLATRLNPPEPNLDELHKKILLRAREHTVDRSNQVSKGHLFGSHLSEFLLWAKDRLHSKRHHYRNSPVFASGLVLAFTVALGLSVLGSYNPSSEQPTIRTLTESESSADGAFELESELALELEFQELLLLQDELSIL